MNVELPDGRVLEDVPEGTTRAQLIEKLRTNGYDVSKLEPADANYGNEGRSRPEYTTAPPVRGAIYKALETLGEPFAAFGEAGADAIRSPIQSAKGIGVGLIKGTKDLLTLPDKLAYRAGLMSTPPEEFPNIDRAYRDAPPIAGVARAVPSTLALGPVSRLGAVADIAGNAGIAATEGYANGSETPFMDALKGAGGATVGRFFPRALGMTASAAKGTAKRLTSGITPEAEALLAQGITPTPGQAFGPGIISTLEDASKRVPGYGSAVQKAQLRTGAQYAAREVTDAMAPMGVPITEQGFKAVARANDILKQSYEQVVPNTFWMPQALDNALNQTRAFVVNHPLMTDAQRAQMGQWVNQKLMPVLQAAQQQGRPVPGRVARDLDIEIGELTRRFNGSEANYALGDAFTELQKNLRFALGATDPAVKAQLQATNQAFAGMVPVAKAFDRAGGKVPTPNQFREAQQGGGALDLSGTPLNTAAMAVIDPRRSGGLERGVGTLGAAGALLAGHPAPLAGVIAGSALGHAAYSEPVVRAMLGKMQLLPHIRQWVEGLPAARKAEFIARMVNEDPLTRQLAAQVGRQLATQPEGATQ